MVLNCLHNTKITKKNCAHINCKHKRRLNCILPVPSPLRYIPVPLAQYVFTYIRYCQLGCCAKGLEEAVSSWNNNCKGRCFRLSDGKGAWSICLCLLHQEKTHQPFFYMYNWEVNNQTSHLMVGVQRNGPRQALRKQTLYHQQKCTPMFNACKCTTISKWKLNS